MDPGEILAHLAANDPSRKRFGAARHGYEALPPLSADELATLTAQLATGGPPPAIADYLDYVRDFSAGGVGPYYGLFPALRAASHVLAPNKVLPHRALPLAHLGCGYFAVLVLHGPDSGQIWLYAHALGVAAPIQPSFTAFYVDWLDRLSHNQWPDGFEALVPVGRCAFQAALGGYLHVIEESLNLGEGELTGPALRDALAGLGTGAIQIAAEGPLFDEGDTVDPCITCARVIENLGADGLARDVIAPGVPPLPAR